MSLHEKSFDPAACPLDSIRVVDLSRLVAGNAVSSQLADFGAEIIKIEDPVKGDPLRAWQSGGVSVHWKLYARNKKSVALSLREAKGRELLLDLAASSEVLIENFRPGTLEKMGLGPDVLHARNPRLIIVRVSGWGQSGPYRDRPGFGTLVESMSGYAARTGFADREPVLPPTALADMIAGLYGAFAVMVALRRVELEGGGGQVIDLPLLDPIFSFIATEAPIYRMTGQIRPRTGSRSETTSPRNVFRTKDGRYIGISASIQAMSERLFRAIGREDMSADPRFRTNSDRVRHAEECEAPIVEFIAARTLEENMEAFAAAEVTAAPVYDIDQFLADPHVREREIVVEVPDPELGRIAMHNIIPRLSETPGRLRTPAPRLGEHTEEILGQFGIDRATLDGLVREGVMASVRNKLSFPFRGEGIKLAREWLMERRRLGGLEVSAVGLGCATMTPFYDQPDPEAAIATIRRAREIGVDFLDTSDAYGAGRNEELIARAVAGHRGDYVIASKFGNLSQSGGERFSDGRPEYVRQACEKSLQRLQTEMIDLYYIHRVDPEVPIEDTVGAMADLVRQGKVRHLGISEAGAATIRRAHEVHPLGAVQIEYSLWTRDVEAEILPLCEELGIGFVAYSPLGRGFLTGAVTSLDTLRDGDARRRMPRFQGENLKRNLALVEELKAHAAAERCTPAQLAIAWVLSRRKFIVPIAGTFHVERLEQNAAASGLRISADTQDALEHVFGPGAAAGARYPAGHLERLMI